MEKMLTVVEAARVAYRQGLCGGLGIALAKLDKDNG